jgi:hypothetical protein
MPAPTAPLIGFVLGIAFAWAAADELGRAASSGTTSRSLVVVTLFSLLVFAPVSAYFLACVPAGFAIAARRASSRRLGPLVQIAALPTLAVGIFLLVASPRLAVSASYAQFHGDFGTRSLAGSPLGYALLWMGLVLFGAVAWTSRSLRRLSRRN